ncbi:hypothetical protein [Oceanicaulis sp.]|uniref:hypothetical protein n=1 Tax=Oceanicaulis sp. TaxID=1924941 RepID=UPI0025CFE406|nr:hypothetical protein [Oceanicaulis sp.]|tara:strand:- start:174 stop:338 length:165 start_codon:yes stop_codon:yes gene_type:complete
MSEPTENQISQIKSYWRNGHHAVEAAALTGIHYERVKAFYATWDATEKEARDGV